MRRIISCLMIAAMVVAAPAFAAPAKGQSESDVMGPGPRRHLSNIVFAGIAGAIMGLSTLSFYGRPQDRLSNIAVGAAIGIIGGALFTTYKAASEPKDFYGYQSAEASSWALSENVRAEPLDSQWTPKAAYVFEF